MNSSSMRPTSGTGHSTRPVTSSSSASSGAQKRPISVTFSCMPDGNHSPPLGLVPPEPCGRAAFSPKRRRRTLLSAPDHGRGAPRSRRPDITGPSVNGTTLPSNRQTMRRSGRTQVKSPLVPQRMDFGQENFARGLWQRGGQIGGGRLAGDALVQHPEIAFLNQILFGRAVLAQEPGKRLLGRRNTRAALGNLSLWHFGGDTRLNRNAAWTVICSLYRRLSCGHGERFEHLDADAFQLPAASSCIRAGISSEKSSRKNSAITRSPRRPRFRRRLLPDCGRGRCRRRVRRRR